MPAPPPTCAVILAGGRATRMGGGDKCRLLVDGIPIIARIIATLAPQAAPITLNANGDPARFADLGLPILPDPVPDQPGPLAGVLAGLDWAAALGHAWLLTVPGDTPFLPPDLVARLHQARGTADHACAATQHEGTQTLHPVIALWSTTQREPLRAALAAGQRRVRGFATPGIATWASTPVDPFTNLNSPADLSLV